MVRSNELVVTEQIEHSEKRKDKEKKRQEGLAEMPGRDGWIHCAIITLVSAG